MTRRPRPIFGLWSAWPQVTATRTTSFPSATVYRCTPKSTPRSWTPVGGGRTRSGGSARAGVACAKDFNPGAGSAFAWLSEIARSVAQGRRHPPQDPRRRLPQRSRLLPASKGPTRSIFGLSCPRPLRPRDRPLGRPAAAPAGLLERGRRAGRVHHRRRDFRTPAVIAERVPAPLPMFSVWVLGGLLALCGALTYAELAALFPRSGGVYVYIREGFGRLPAFLFGGPSWC